MRFQFQMVCAVVATFSIVQADADIVLVPPFTGQASDNVDDIIPPGNFLIDAQIDVFEGQATFVSMVDPPNNTTIHLWGGSCIGGDCSIPRSSPYLIGSTTTQAIEFNTPAFRFGSYFTNTSGADDVTATFYDENGEVLGIVNVDVPAPGTLWYWNGWSSDVPFARIEFVGNGLLEGFIWFDDLEVNFEDVETVGDLDFDGDVDAIDLIKLLGQWGKCFDCDQCSADLDGDCLVGTNDLIVLLGNWS